MKRDLVLGLVGGVFLLAAMAAVFQYEGSRAPAVTLGSQSFDVQWITTEGAGPGAAGSATADGGPEAGGLAVDEANLVEAMFTLEWTDDVGDPDTFRFTVQPPAGAGEARTVTGASGELTLTFPGINALPPAATIFGDTEETARARALEQHTKHLGHGDWAYTVELLQAGHQTAPVGGIVLQEDPGNDWTLASTLRTYAPALSARTAT